MSTTIITQFSQNDNSDAQTTTNYTFVQDEPNIIVGNARTQGEGREKFTDYEIKVKVNSILVHKLHLDMTKSVRRRYSDFIWLYNSLNALRINLPKLPVKKFKVSIIPVLNKKNFEEDFIVQRGKELEKFLNKLTLNPLVQGSEVFKMFLKEDSLNKGNDK